MSIVEETQPAVKIPTEHELLEEYNRQIETISAVFFDAIDDPQSCLNTPVQVGYFMDEESSGTHLPVKEILLSGVTDLCAHPDSQCELSGDLSFTDGTRLILTSEKSGNQLIEARQGDFASVFWIVRPGQALPY